MYDKANEEDLIVPKKIRNDYAFSKYQAEQNSLRYARKGVPIVITRLGNIYGSGDTNSRLVPKVINNKRKRNDAYIN